LCHLQQLMEAALVVSMVLELALLRELWSVL
jgi:hypothetical protein